MVKIREQFTKVINRKQKNRSKKSQKMYLMPMKIYESEELKTSKNQT